MATRITVKELAKQLNIPVHRVYYALRVGAVAATWDEQVRRYFFDRNTANNAKKILTRKGN